MVGPQRGLPGMIDPRQGNVGEMRRERTRRAGRCFAICSLSIASLHKIRQGARDAPAGLDQGFDHVHAGCGRAPTAAGRLVRAGLIQILFPIRFGS